MNILLLHPPQAKAAEPPAGIPLLAATLRAHGITCTICDLNVEGLHHLFDSSPTIADTWSKRAAKNRFRHVESLCSEKTYQNLDKYKRAVVDLNKVIENHGKTKGISLSLANYQDPLLSPLKSEDLLSCAEHHEDNLYYPFFSKRLRGIIEGESPSYIGISLNYLSQANCTFSIIGFLKKHFPEIEIILGGGLVTTWLQSPHWQDPFCELIDHMVSGPGEFSLLNILQPTNPVKRCRPDYTDLLQNTYLAPGTILPYAASTGCFWRKCSFCPETSECNPYKQVKVETAMAELNSLIEETSPRLIHFLDNALSPAMLTALSQSTHTIPWYGFVRFTSHLADPDFCRKLRHSGCTMLKLGLESGSQAVLDQMDKGIDLKLVHAALDALHQAGIMTYVYLLFGTPAESVKEARETLDYVARHHEQITFLNLAIFNLPTGSSQSEELETRDFYDGDLSIYSDFHHPQNWNRKEIRRFLESDFKKEPVIHRILQSDPLHFTSNHAPFFVSQKM